MYNTIAHSHTTIGNQCRRFKPAQSVNATKLSKQPHTTKSTAAQAAILLNYI